MIVSEGKEQIQDNHVGALKYKKRYVMLTKTILKEILRWLLGSLVNMLNICWERTTHKKVRL